MAKKAVATLQTGSKKLTKIIKMTKKGNSKSYSFTESIIPSDRISQWLKEN